jgi:hypothetical protein
LTGALCRCTAAGSAMLLLEAVAFVVSVLGVWLTTARSLQN